MLVHDASSQGLIKSGQQMQILLVKLASPAWTGFLVSSAIHPLHENSCALHMRLNRPRPLFPSDSQSGLADDHYQANNLVSKKSPLMSQPDFLWPCLSAF